MKPITFQEVRNLISLSDRIDVYKKNLSTGVYEDLGEADEIGTGFIGLVIEGEEVIFEKETANPYTDGESITMIDKEGETYNVELFRFKKIKI